MSLMATFVFNNLSLFSLTTDNVDLRDVGNVKLSFPDLYKE